jgi:hypothetical protein
VATTEELIDLLRQGGVLDSGRTLYGNEMIDLAAPLLETYAAPDFVTLMTSESATQESSACRVFGRRSPTGSAPHTRESR